MGLALNLIVTIVFVSVQWRIAVILLRAETAAAAAIAVLVNAWIA